MASVFGHAILGATITKVLDYKNTKWLILTAIISTILPDIDVLAFNFGVPYGHPLGHRGFTHSIVFAILWAFLVNVCFRKAK